MSAEKSESVEDPKNDYRIKGGLWASAWKIAAALGVIGLAASAVGAMSDVKRFAFSYLFAFAFVLTLGLGALFFVLVQYITSAGWSVTVRRTAEFFMSGLPIMAVLFVPILFVAGHLFPWMHEHHGRAGHEHRHHHAASATAPESATTEAAPGEQPAAGEEPAAAAAEHPLSAEDEEYEQIEHEEEAHVLAEKRPYLNTTFFFVRVGLYFLGWIWLSRKYFKLSTDQDKSKDPQNTVKAAGGAPVALIVFALTLTFAAFDWLMSLNPLWYSTIFGVWIFAGSVVTIHALITLVTLSFRNAGYTGKAITTEHFHDLGKLTFGFTVFWAYIGFAQFFLIWYASIPEETTFYHQRWGNGPWMPVSIGILVLHFVAPFLVLLSRNTKRRSAPLALGAAILILMHVVEMYWIVMPNFVPRGAQPGVGPGDVLQLHWLDFTSLLGVAGVYLAWVFFQMTRHPLIPVGDPRLARSIKFENA